MTKFITEERREEILKEIEELNKDLNGRIADKIAASPSKDIEEDATYAEALEEQDMTKIKIEGLKVILREAELIEADNKVKGYVTLGSTVVVEINGNEKTLTLVGVDEADPTQGKISYQSPLGEAMIGAKKGETVLVFGPNESEQEVIVKKIK